MFIEKYNPRPASFHGKLILRPGDRLRVPVFLRKDAAAVLLHIKPQLPRPLVARPEVGAEVAVEELDPVLFPEALCRGGDVVVLLVGGGQQGGRKGGKAVFSGKKRMLIFILP